MHITTHELRQGDSPPRRASCLIEGRIPPHLLLFRQDSWRSQHRRHRSAQPFLLTSRKLAPGGALRTLQRPELWPTLQGIHPQGRVRPVSSL